MKVHVDKDKCIACGLCVSTCPDVFAFESDGLAGAKQDAVDKASPADIQSAADGCPTSAIVVDH